MSEQERLTQIVQKVIEDWSQSEPVQELLSRSLATARSEGYRAGMMRASVIIASAKSNGWDVTATINRALESIRAEADKLERGEGE